MRLDKLLLAALITVATPVFGLAQPFDDLAHINFYLVHPDYTGCLTFDDAVTSTCNDLVSDPIVGPAFLWLVLSREDGWLPDGVGGIQFGIEYDADLIVDDWTLCTGGAEIPQDDPTGTWPESGTGNAATWGVGCYVPPEETASLGYLLVGAGDMGHISITGDPRISPDADVYYTNCMADPFRFPPENVGVAHLEDGTMPTCFDPSTPVDEVTWARLKESFR